MTQKKKDSVVLKGSHAAADRRSFLKSAAVAGAGFVGLTGRTAKNSLNAMTTAQDGSTGRVVPPEVEKANVAVVNDFCAAFEQKDLPKIVSLLSDDCTYRPTQTTAAVVGKDKVTETIKGFLDRDLVLEVLDTVAFGPLVLNERDDILVTEDGTSRTFRIAAGLFFVENRKIVEWTDYYLE